MNDESLLMHKVTEPQNPMANRIVVVCLGCLGDLCIILPAMYQSYLETNQKPVLVVAENYAPLLEGVSYVEVAVYNDDYTRGAPAEVLDIAVAKIQQQFIGKTVHWVNPVPAVAQQDKRGSFLEDLWARLGREGQWKNLPLIFDRRVPSREAGLLASYRMDLPVILCSLNGISSPFFGSVDLLEFIVHEFPGCTVIDLDQIRIKYPYDLLGLMDRAKVLVTCDTFPLHLSKASNVPVVALACDCPDKWRGTPWHRRYAFYGRYSEYPARRNEIIQTIRRKIHDIPDVRPMPIHGLLPNSYNPSIVQKGGLTLVTSRYHHAGGWETKLTCSIFDPKACVALDGARDLDFPDDVNWYSLEDMRMFLHRDQVYGSYTVARWFMEPRRFGCVMAYGPMDGSGYNWRVTESFQPKYGRNDFSAMEKNWVFFSNHGKLYAIYSPGLVLEIEGDRVVQEHRSEPPEWPWGEIRGGTTPLPLNDVWVRFFHSQVKLGPKPRDVRYYMGAAVMSPEAPFEVLAVSRAPILAGHEWANPECKHWKANVIIPYGAIKDGKDFLVTVGVNDSCSCICRVSEQQLNLP